MALRPKLKAERLPAQSSRSRFERAPQKDANGVVEGAAVTHSGMGNSWQRRRKTQAHDQWQQSCALVSSFPSVFISPKLTSPMQLDLKS